MLKLGDFVKPKPEWIGDPNNVPTGRVRALAMSGQAAYVGDERRAFGTYVFDVVDNPTEEELAKPTQEETAKPAQVDLFATISRTIVMDEVELAIHIHSRSVGKRAVTAWARTKDALLVCHPIVDDEAAWTITHRPTGLRVNPSRALSKKEALALIDVYAPLADWAAVKDDPELLASARNAIEHAYDQFSFVED